MEEQIVGQVFCPMKLAHIAVMRCGEYQRELNCGKLNGEAWPWLAKTGECPTKASDKEIETVKKLMVVRHLPWREKQARCACGKRIAPGSRMCRDCFREKHTENKHYKCPACGGFKSWTAQLCSYCYLRGLRKSRHKQGGTYEN